MKKIAGFLTVGLFCFMFFASTPTRSAAQKGKVRRKANKIENSYIVVLDDSVVGEKGAYSISRYVADDLASLHGGKVKHVYKHALNGFSVEMSEADAEALSKDFRVALVEEDGVMTADATQTNPPWGLNRIDQRNLPLNAPTSITGQAPAFGSTSSTPGSAPLTRNLAVAPRTSLTHSAATARIATAMARTFPAPSAVQLMALPKAHYSAVFAF